jgi:hypothetical protein
MNSDISIFSTPFFIYFFVSFFFPFLLLISFYFFHLLLFLLLYGELGLKTGYGSPYLNISSCYR